MNYENSTIPFNENVGIMTTDIRQTLGEPNTIVNNRFGRLCVSSKVNKWSKFKPIFFKINGEMLTDTTDRGKVTGFAMIGQSFEHIPIIDYKLPDPSRRDVPYRLRDFVGYKHKAPKLAANGSTVLTGANQSTPLTVQFDTCEMSLFHLSGGGTYGSCNAICAIEKVSGGHKVVGYRYLSDAELKSETPIRYQFDIPYTTPNFAYTTTFDKDFYICLGTGESEPGVGGVVQTPTPRYIVGDPEKDCKATVKITVRIDPSPNNPLQWTTLQANTHITGVDGIELGPTPRINWAKWEVWFRSDATGSLANLTKVRITGLAGSFPAGQYGQSIDIEYQKPNGSWALLKRIRQTDNTQNGGNWGHDLGRGDMDISGYSSPIEKFRIKPSDFI